MGVEKEDVQRVGVTEEDSRDRVRLRIDDLLLKGVAK